jgi:hypothetical protein
VKRDIHWLVLAFGFLLPVAALATTTRHGATWARIENLQDSILAYAAENCRFPSYAELRRESDKPGPLHGESLNDAWDQPLIYHYPTQYGSAPFDLYSVGVNGVDDHGAKDDISNWQAFNSSAYAHSLDVAEWAIIGAVFDLPVLLLAWLAWRAVKTLRGKPAA